MKKLIKTSPTKRCNQSPLLKNKNRLQISRAMKPLDRRSYQLLRSLRSVHFRVARVKNGRRASRSLRIAGSNGDQRIACAGWFLTKSNKQQYWSIFKKYRLKLDNFVNYSIQAPNATFRLLPLSRLRQQRRSAKHYPASNSLHSYALRGAVLNSRWHALQLRSVHSAYLPPESKYRRRGWKHWLKRYQARMRNRKQLHAGWLVHKKSTALKKAVRHLAAMRYRAIRVDFKGYKVSYQRRWWWNRKLRRTNRKELRKAKKLKFKKTTNTKTELKSNKKRSAWLRRRRFRGKRLFSGFFGPRRWRAERRDRFHLRRERRQEPLQRRLVYSSARTIASAKEISTHQLQNLRLLLANLRAKGHGVSAISQRQRALLLKHVRATFKAGHNKKTTCKNRKKLYTRTLRSTPLLQKNNLTVRTHRTLHTNRAAAQRYRNTLQASGIEGYTAPRLYRLSYKRRLTNSLLAASTKSTVRSALKTRQFMESVQLNQAVRELPVQLSWNTSTNSHATNTERLETLLVNSTKHMSGRALLTRASQYGLNSKFNNFLQKTAANTLTAPAPGAVQSAFHASLAVSLQKLRYRELRFYHKRPRLRLPNTKITRSRRRRAGLVTFVKNSLKQPRTARGLRNQLLPPLAVYNTASTSYVLGATSTARKLLARAERPEDNWPLFWRRPHSRANIKAINAVRRRQYSRRKRQFILRQKRWAARVNMPFKPVLLSKIRSLFKDANFSTLGRKNGLQDTLTNRLYRRLVWAARKRSTGHRKIAHFFVRKRGKKTTRVSNHQRDLLEVRRTKRSLTPVTSRIVEHTFLAPQKAPDSQRLLGLWHARSTKSMLVAERALSAWSPQLSVRNRRAHFPRVQGVPVRRRMLSFTAKRVRRNLNAKLLARNVPQRRYTDYAPVKLQYYHGSVGSVGYVRFRRVHRSHSKHNRWWRPNKVAVPFPHPFSRRALNAKRYTRADFSVVRPSRYTGFTRLCNKRAVFLHSKFPPRPIPWRNFRFKRPRWGRVPKTLQRWTFTKRNGRTGRTRPRKSRVILQRTAREMRELEGYASNRNVWKNRQWNFADKAALRGGAESNLFVALRFIPKTIWKALQQRCGSPATYAVMQHRILDNFRRWARKEQRAGVYFAEVTLGQAQLFLVDLLAKTLQLTPKQITQVVQDTQRHSMLRDTLFDKKVRLKAVNFLRLRTLPRLDRAPNAGSILQRERSGLYRRWLYGVEGAAKRLGFGYVPTSRSRYTANVAINFGRRRARFPASGRRRKSYDSVLHAFTKKIAPARLRRAGTLRFKRAFPQIVSDFRENVLTANSYAGLERRRTFVRKLSSVNYLSAPWRELLQHCIEAGKTTCPTYHVSAKRRFLALPIKAEINKQARYALQLAASYKQQMRLIRAGILRRALRRRREERLFIDLRHSVLQRRLPKEQATHPWKLRRAAKRWPAVKMGAYNELTAQKRVTTPGRWTLVHLSAVGPQHEYLELSPLPKILVSGERIAPASSILRKDRRAFRGFLLPGNTPKRRKLRRKMRDSGKRSRVSRRLNPAGRHAAFRNTKHWSEKKDQDFRTATLRHRRISYAKRTADALSGKVSPRCDSLVNLRISKKLCNSRRARFVFNKHYARASKKVRLTAPTARVLVSVSSLVHQSRLARASEVRIAQQRRRSYRAPRCQRRKVRLQEAKFNFRVKQEQHSVATRLLETAGVQEPTISLWFQKPAIRVVKTEKAKENEALADIAQKEGRYKITAQYVESLTAFIPELMNHAFSKKIEQNAQQIHYNTAQHLIRNIYWSLRVYLNVDPFDIRFFARDKRPAARVRLFEQISDMSEFQLTDQAQRAALRYRFQPGKMLRAPNTMRFRGDWLRAFFPAKHALYQENPEDYRKFLFKTRRIRSLRIGPRGIASWITQKQLIGHETRARQILTLRFSRKRRRFETVLQTTRRAPEAESTNALADSVSRTQFFSRKFSTYAGRGLAATSRWIHRQKRFITLEEGWRVLTPAAQVSARNRSIVRIESRGRANYVSTEWAAVNNTFLDTRFTRAKSSRSRQYLIRMTAGLRALKKQMKFTNISLFQKLVNRRLSATLSTETHWARTLRRTAAVSLRLNWVASACAPLQALRAVCISRRVGTLRTNRRVRTAYTLHTPQLRARILAHKVSAALPREAIFYLQPFNRRKKLESRRRFFKRELHDIKYKLRLQVVNKKLHSVQSKLRILLDKQKAPLFKTDVSFGLKQKKRLLKRTLFLMVKERKLRIIKNKLHLLLSGRNPVFLKNKFRLSAKEKKLLFSKATALLMVKEKKLRLLKTKVRLSIKKKAYSTLKMKKCRSLKNNRRLADVKIKQRKIRCKLRLLRRKREWSMFKRRVRFETGVPNSENKVFLPRKLLLRTPSTARLLQPLRAHAQSHLGRARFFKKAVSRGIFRGLDFARACALYTRFNRQAPFEAHRSRLWDDLTQRWMKKYRIGRYWLRDTSRWLRDPWLSQIVACDAALRPDRFGGELRSRAQQVGEYVADVDAQGRDIKRKNAPKERHKFQKILPVINDPEIKKTNKILKKGSRLDRSLARQRLRISAQAFRKPMPGIRLANYEFRDVIREHKENKAKSAKQKREDEETRVKAYWARKEKKLPPERPKRLPLKHPANLWLPHVIWKEIQRRIRKFEWRESDEVFFRRGFRNAFRFHANERHKAPWLEHLMYTRATYSTRLREFRRRQYPHEQKKFKWLQRVRRMLYPGRNAWYIKGRRWPQLRRYNQKLHYSLFNLRDRRASRRHFKKLNGRTRPSISAFVSMSKGLTNRLDLTCLQMGLAPSIYWARIVAEFGLLRVNGTIVYDPTYQIKSDDIVYPNWDTIARFQHYFKPQLRAREDYLRRNQASTSFYPTNMEYHRGIRAFVYKHAPDESDLRKSSRIFAPYFRWFKLDSV